MRSLSSSTVIVDEDFEVSGIEEGERESTRVYIERERERGNRW